MSCYHPIECWYRPGYPVCFKQPKEAGMFAYKKISVGCGKCIGCKLDHSREWSCRLLMEYETNPKAIFLTLTYNDDNCPLGLNKSDFQNFIKRLRHHFSVGVTRTIKYYGCGEYGDSSFRPHYHAVIFGLDPFKDLDFDYYKINDDLYSSEVLSKIWGKGFISFAPITIANISYTTQYTNKKALKMNNKSLKKFGLLDEFQLCSQRLGLDYWILNKSRIIDNNGELFFNGQKYKLPRYFMKKLEEDSADFKKIKKYREKLAKTMSLAVDKNQQFLNESLKVQTIKRLKRDKI